MSESDTMFNERDRRCAAVQLMLSADPSYDNRTIASTLKMQIRTVQRAQGDLNNVYGYGYGLWCSFKWGPHHATSHLRSRLESVPGCAEECGDRLVQSGGCWQNLGVAAGLGAGSQVQRHPGLASEEVLRFCTFLSLAQSTPNLNPLNYFVWSYVENITNMTALVEKACSQFRIRIEAVIEAERRLHWIDVSSIT